ncbi:bacterial low temperature requirement A protein-domain-containing protein [Cokeromyces recurvatus]|uniref:bacterial low temperature requirement A protein-domain-containing protein n=1 Tax=Cokeromyces recurvatus TaxID=90255 RepID=UPI00221EB31F|nr:bacterial low temperature requirement A protein-domain-containing protein [Cokeromyces recurvatus]KAI7898855.1 bacterial low temperature requirement A protein-domain-containing protein [Cokeromyces recurvatus]
MSMRRGPTLRASRYRPPIGRMNIGQSRDDEEERIGLTNAINETEHNEKIESDNEDTSAYPMQEYKTTVNQLPKLHQQNKNLNSDSSSQNNIHYTLILHFRQLRGNQRFVLDYDAANDFCEKLNFTQQERIQFNGVRDTDGLTEFLYKIKREFSIKIHHKIELLRSGEHHGHHHHHADNHIIEFNENFYVEFKVKHNHHAISLPVEATRRPFFQHPEPDLSADIGEEKAASWLELFYDLFYVATLTQFTHSHHIMDWGSLFLYAQWFIITWWAWLASSLYTSRFDTDDVVHHIYKLIEMCAVIGMAGSSEYFLNSAGYVYGYIALKAVLAIEYFVVFIVSILAKSKSRMALLFYVGANLLSIGLWVSSLTILEKDIHRILWYVGVLCEILVNVIVRGDKRLSWAASHLAERLGLLSLIVLGENLMGLVSLVSATGNYLITAIPNFMAVFIIFGFFFMYFEDFNKEIFLHNTYHQVWVYLHFPLHLCQVAFGISLIDILKIFRFQLISDHKLPDEEVTQDDTTIGSGQHSSTPATTAHDGTSASTHQESSGESESPHHKAKRAVHDFLLANRDKENDAYYYNPMKLTNEQNQISNNVSHKEPVTTITTWTSWCLYFATTVVTGTISMIAGNDNNAEEHAMSTSHHLARRSEPTGSFTETISDSQIVFVYKTFLIFAGLILIINSLIKALNTKISDIYGRIIIGSRLLNAIILWSMCALPFAKLDAIVLLCTMVGSLVFQALIDLLD